MATEDLVGVLLNKHLDEAVGIRNSLGSRVSGEGELADFVGDTRGLRRGKQPGKCKQSGCDTESC